MRTSFSCLPGSSQELYHEIFLCNMIFFAPLALVTIYNSTGCSSKQKYIPTYLAILRNCKAPTNSDVEKIVPFIWTPPLKKRNRKTSFAKKCWCKTIGQVISFISTKSKAYFSRDEQNLTIKISEKMKVPRDLPDSFLHINQITASFYGKWIFHFHLIKIMGAFYSLKILPNCSQFVDV